jgi:putative endopeptidase
MRRILSLFLTFTLIISLTLGVSAEGTASAPVKAEYLSNSEAAMMLFSAADYYNPEATAAYILGELEQNKLLTVETAYIMTDRAFGELPEPAAAWLIPAAEKPEFEVVPEAAKAAVENLGNARVITDEDADGLRNPNKLFTEGELKTLIARIYAEIGKNKADDFFWTQNSEYFADLELLAGNTSAGVTSGVNKQVNEQIAALFESLAAGEFEQGTPEQKAADFYQAFMKLGDIDNNISSIEKYLSRIDKAEDTAAIHAVFLDMMDEIGYQGFLMLGTMGNIRGDGSNIYSVSLPALTLKNGETGYSDPDTYKTAENYNAELLALIGDSDPAANAAAVTAFEKSVYEASLPREEAINMDKAFFNYTLAEVQAIVPDWNFDPILVRTTYEPGANKLVVVPDDGRYAAFAKIFEPENLTTLKTFVKLDLVRNLRRYLGDDFRKAYASFNQKCYGATPLPKDEYYVQAAAEEMNLLIQKLYVNTYVDPRTKSGVEEMADGLIKTFLSRMDSYKWMSDETREEAVRKLSKLRVVAVHPDNMHSAWDDIEITSKDAFKIRNDYSIALNKLDLGGYGDKPDIDFTIMQSMKTYEVNAMFIADYNIIYFPAGILTAPNYDPDASLAVNLGGIGAVMGHEITHAFDNNGSQFDADGLIRNWWTEDDFAAFDGKVKNVVNYYQGYEFAPGVANNSSLTVSENIADIGGVSVALQYLRENTEKPDYKAFFESYASSWADVRTRQRAIVLAGSDVHSGSWVRVNAVLSLFDEFYEVYNVKPGDGMYVPPEKRVSIW